jgi:hypothetical protein
MLFFLFFHFFAESFLSQKRIHFSGFNLLNHLTIFQDLLDGILFGGTTFNMTFFCTYCNKLQHLVTIIYSPDSILTVTNNLTHLQLIGFQLKRFA